MRPSSAPNSSQSPPPDLDSGPATPVTRADHLQSPCSPCLASRCSFSGTRPLRARPRPAHTLASLPPSFPYIPHALRTQHKSGGQTLPLCLSAVCRSGDRLRSRRLGIPRTRYGYCSARVSSCSARCPRRTNGSSSRLATSASLWIAGRHPVAGVQGLPAHRGSRRGSRTPQRAASRHGTYRHRLSQGRSGAVPRTSRTLGTRSRAHPHLIGVGPGVGPARVQA